MSDRPNTSAGLVCIAAFGLDEGESLGALLGGHFAADVDPVKARVMYAVQQPGG